MCSNTIFRRPNFTARGASTSSMNTLSRSNTSTPSRVDSPCTSSGMPSDCIAESVSLTRAMSVTPASECVVAPAGYSLTPCTTPEAFARSISCGGVESVRYSVISGWKVLPAGRAARIRWRYACASAVVVIGGFRLGITMARPNCAAVNAATEARAGPSRRCTCQSSGRRRVSVVMRAPGRAASRS
jgi:hypothetical protein